LQQEGGFNLDELGDLCAFEVEIYYYMLLDKLKKQNAKNKS
jgi:hypothetical protein